MNIHKEIAIVFGVKNFEGKISEYIRECLYIFSKHISILPQYYQVAGKADYRYIKGWEDPKIYRVLESKSFSYLIIQTSGKEYQVYISKSALVIDVKKDILQAQQLRELFMGIFLLLPYLRHANIYERGSYRERIFASFTFIGRDSSFSGFRWLTYLNAEEMTLNGGEALYHLPYLTKAEPFKDGILIQVGESPDVSLSYAGQKQLYLATQAWCALVKSQGLYEDDVPPAEFHPIPPTSCRIDPDQVQEIQLSTPLRKGQNTLIDLSIAVAWSEQKILLHKIKATVTAVPQGDIGYYELMVILPQEVSVEGVTYQLDSETRFRVEG